MVLVILAIFAILSSFVETTLATRLDDSLGPLLLAPRSLLRYIPWSFEDIWNRFNSLQSESLLTNALMVALLTACLYQLRRMHETSTESSNLIPEKIFKRIGKTTESSEKASRDPGLLRKHSSLKSYTTSVATYPALRVFYRPHPQLDKLPSKPTPLPLLVFIHGLGGSVAQFHPLLTSLVGSASCLAVDLPGCGLSEFLPTSWHAYSHAALVELLGSVIDDHCDRDAGQEVVLIGHSMGCSLSVSLASQTSELSGFLRSSVAGIISICPKASNPRKDQIAQFKKLLNIPTPVFDLWRQWDRRGGVDSASVKRFLGNEADLETKKLQMKFNEESRTGVFRRVAFGSLPTIQPNGDLKGGLPGPQVWAGLNMPVFAIAGKNDHVIKAEEIIVIREALSRGEKLGATGTVSSQEAIPETTHHLALEVSSQETTVSDTIQGQVERSIDSDVTTAASDYTTTLPSDLMVASRRKFVLKTTILPPPATHALLYDQSTYRTLAGLIQTFLANHIDGRLSHGWQLQYLSTEGKWEVKNLAKWQAVKPVSEPINNVFRAMKTLREVDEEHSPPAFIKNWSDKIKAVVDISHENPVYNPQTLDNGGIQYNKIPTVSKIPPTSEEVKTFIALVDQLRSEFSSEDTRLIGVHCHYGFNRTGFFICSYLIEREGFTVQQAIDEFQVKRPPGIRHEHFIDTLWVRYCVGLKRVPTM